MEKNTGSESSSEAVDASGGSGEKVKTDGAFCETQSYEGFE